MVLNSTIHKDDAGKPAHGTLTFLDGLRGLAAVYVMLFHARWLLWEGFSTGYLQHPALYSLPATLLAYGTLLFSYGRQAVLLFFILSGFVIHLRYARQQKNEPNKPFDTVEFFLRRFKRIYPPLLAALLLTLVIDTHGVTRIDPVLQHKLALLGQSVDYTNIQPRLFSALLLIPNAPEWGTDAPLWSLRLEWWFYILYPVLWWLFRRSIKTGGLPQ